MHRRVSFDAIVSFDLYGAGGLAWRLGKDLGIPACGWATGGDLAQPPGSARQRVVLQALTELDLIFYQSRELFEVASELIGLHPNEMPQDRHLVLARGIEPPPNLPVTQIRSQVRSAWGISDNQVLVLNIGRVVREKGMFELLEAMEIALARDQRIACAIVGSHPGFDETATVRKRLEASPCLRQRIKLLPACSPDQTWEYLCAADIFAFPSHKRFEGMPNSLLEAMVMGIPAVAFAIRPVLEIEAETGALFCVPTFDTNQYAEAILRLANSPAERTRIGQRGKCQVLKRFMVKKNTTTALTHLTRVVEKRRVSGLEERMSVAGAEG
jgi:glycosyltransferase involved in cell wall biosynthesis